MFQGNHYAYCRTLSRLKGIFYLEHVHDDSEKLEDDIVKYAVLYH